MNWFTIYIQNPNPTLSVKCQKNSASQFILFHGKKAIKSIRDEARIASLDCEEVQVFKGKRLGKLIETYRHGAAECGYCGKAHL